MFRFLPVAFLPGPDSVFVPSLVRMRRRILFRWSSRLIVRISMIGTVLNRSAAKPSRAEQSCQCRYERTGGLISFKIPALPRQIACEESAAAGALPRADGPLPRWSRTRPKSHSRRHLPGRLGQRNVVRTRDFHRRIDRSRFLRRKCRDMGRPVRVATCFQGEIALCMR